MDESATTSFYNQTVLHPLGLAAVLVLGIAMVAVRRQYALIPMAIMACFIAPGQRIAVFTLNFDLLRVMVIFGMARVLMRGEWRGFVWRALDIAMMAWAVVGTVAFWLLFGTMEALKFRMGQSYDIIGVYLLGRCLIKGWTDVETLVKGFMFISIPVAIAFLIERATGRNAFAVLGGVPEITDIREGRLRCQGAFAHPILAGCFWASLMPMVVAQWWRRGQARWQVAAALACFFTIVITCASSTPVAAVMFGAMGLCLFPFRKWMGHLRWVMLVVLVGLHLVMEAPVWHLIARIDLAGGSTGWHRFLLIDEWINHLSDWWLVGVISTEHWGREHGYVLIDITNQFVLEGVRGGLLTVLLFVAVIVLAFRDVGMLWRRAEGDRYRMLLAWALGVALFIHCMNYIAVSYFGQIRFLYYMLLAVIGSAAAIPAHRTLPVLAERAIRYRLVPVRQGGAAASATSAGQPRLWKPQQTAGR